MYLNVPFLLASLALATTASADYLDVTVICVLGGCSYAGSMSSQPWLFIFPCYGYGCLSCRYCAPKYLENDLTNHCWLLPT